LRFQGSLATNHSFRSKTRTKSEAKSNSSDQAFWRGKNVPKLLYSPNLDYCQLWSHFGIIRWEYLHTLNNTCHSQGCQLVYFHTKNFILHILFFIYFGVTNFCYIIWLFGIFCGLWVCISCDRLVYVPILWYLGIRFIILVWCPKKNRANQVTTSLHLVDSFLFRNYYVCERPTFLSWHCTIYQGIFFKLLSKVEKY
jgi:hypothetical protein